LNIQLLSKTQQNEQVRSAVKVVRGMRVTINKMSPNEVQSSNDKQV